MGLRNLEDNSRIECSDLSYKEGRTARSTVEPFLQVRYHRNIAASSLAADCNNPQRPPAFLISIKLKTVCHNGVHTHTLSGLKNIPIHINPMTYSGLLHTLYQMGTWNAQLTAKAELQLHYSGQQIWVPSTIDDWTSSRMYVDESVGKFHRFRTIVFSINQYMDHFNSFDIANNSESPQMGAPFCHVCGNTMFL